MHLVLCGEERGVHELFTASDLLNIAYMNFSSETRLFLLTTCHEYVSMPKALTALVQKKMMDN